MKRVRRFGWPLAALPLPLTLLDQAVVFFQDCAKFVVGQRDNFVVIDAGHGFGGDHGVDDGFFRGLDGGGEDGLDLVVGQHFQVDDVVSSSSARIGSGEGDEDVAGAIAGNAAIAAESERNAAREAFELVRDERSVRGNNDDDRAVVVVDERGSGVRIIRGNFPADGNSGNAQIISRTVITLHQNSSCVAAFFFA